MLQYVLVDHWSKTYVVEAIGQIWLRRAMVTSHDSSSRQQVTWGLPPIHHSFSGPVCSLETSTEGRWGGTSLWNSETQIASWCQATHLTPKIWVLISARRIKYSPYTRQHHASTYFMKDICPHDSGDQTVSLPWREFKRFTAPTQPHFPTTSVMLSQQW